MTRGWSFSHNPGFKELNPRWGLYSKKYSEKLVNSILSDFSCEFLVIKPKSASQGRGVIILHRDQLDETLQYILIKTPTLKNDPDKAYNYWPKDPHRNFIVEEFYSSDPVYAPHISEDSYDGTMRVAVMLTYDQHVMDVEFLYLFWKLPKKSLGDEGSFTDKHKSFSLSEKNYSAVDAQIAENVEQQLKEGLLLIYEKLLNE
jgi:hypothetical protein